VTLLFRQTEPVLLLNAIRSLYRYIAVNMLKSCYGLEDESGPTWNGTSIFGSLCLYYQEL